MISSRFTFESTLHREWFSISRARRRPGSKRTAMSTESHQRKMRDRSKIEIRSCEALELGRITGMSALDTPPAAKKILVNDAYEGRW